MANGLTKLEDRVLILQDKVDVLRKRYDPNQLRDEIGRWSRQAGTRNPFAAISDEPGPTKDSTFYHGTTSKALLRILRNGIMPGMAAGGLDRASARAATRSRDPAAAARYSGYEADAKGKVYASGNLYEAGFVAEVMAKERNAKPVIFKVRIPDNVRIEAGNRMVDEVFIREKIKPEWIVGFKRPSGLWDIPGPWIDPKRLVKAKGGRIIYVVIDLAKVKRNGSTTPTA